MPREGGAVLTFSQATQTAAAVARIQGRDGCIPWNRGRHADAWNMIEATMALDVAGMHREARHAYEWLAHIQRPDGAWAAAYLDGEVMVPVLDANFSCYLPTGVWHHYLTTGDLGFLQTMWPHVERCLQFVLPLQKPSGAIAWARDENYKPAGKGLVASSSSIHLSIKCAVEIAEHLGDARPDWELAGARIAAAVVDSPFDFEDKSRFSMDWYYPVLCGLIAGPAAEERLRARWEDFVIDGRGVRCVADRAWATAGETAELVLTLCGLGRRDEAAELLATVAYLRADDGMYWTGATWPEGTIWPREKTTWTAGSVLLAAARLAGGGPTAAVFDLATVRSPVSLDAVGDSL